MKNDKKHNQGFDATIHELVSFFLHSPYWVKVICCYLIILISSMPFYFGYQIYPVNNEYNTQDMNPECLSIERIGYLQDKNFFNLTYSLNLHDSLTRDISFGLFRIFVDGQFYSEELRKNNIDQIILYQNNLYSISYELFQEGQTNFTIRCIDRDLFNKTIDIDEIQNCHKYTIFHKDNSISNVCFSGKEKIVFISNSIKNFKSEINNQFTYFNLSIDSFLSKNHDIQTPHYPVIDINQKTTFELLSEILPYALYLSQNNFNNQINNFMVNTNSKESKDVIKFIQSIIKEPLTQPKLTFSDYCYTDDVRLYNYSIIQKLHEKTIKNDSKKYLANDKQIDDLYNSFKQISLNKYGDSTEFNISGKPKIVFALNKFDNFSNLNELKEFFGSNENFKIVNMSELTLQQKILEFSNTQIMISTDDGDEVSNAMWMPDDSSLVCLYEKKERLSPAIKLAKSFNINVFPVELYREYNTNQKVELPLKSIEKIINDL